MYLRKVDCGSVNPNELVQDTVQWRELVNTIMNLQVS
jgi:hypothetical protein